MSTITVYTNGDICLGSKRTGWKVWQKPEGTQVARPVYKKNILGGTYIDYETVEMPAKRYSLAFPSQTAIGNPGREAFERDLLEVMAKHPAEA